MPEQRPSRVALVTGAAGGIGSAVVDALVVAGCHVLALDLAAGRYHGLPGVRHPLAEPTALDALAERHGDRVATVRADVRDADALAAAARQAVDTWGRLDVAVAGAAVIAGGEPVWTSSPEADAAWRTQWEVDVLGVRNTASAAVPLMLAGPDPAGCRFVALASAAGARGLYGLGGYTAAKHAVVGLVRALAADLVGTGATAVAVSPGATRTPMLQATADLYGVTTDELASHQLLREALDPAEVAAAVALCCSPEGRALNGSVVAADGGFE